MAWWSDQATAALLVGGALLVVLTTCLRGRRTTSSQPLWASVLVVAGLVVGMGAYDARLAAWERRTDSISSAGARTWHAVVIADGAEGRFGERTTVRVEGGPFSGCVVRLGLPDGVRAPDIGRVVRFKAVARAPAQKRQARDAARDGVVASARPWRFEELGWTRGVLGDVYRWRARAARSLARVPGDASALLAGIALGDRRRLRGSDVEADFRALGLSHALAVSGTHLGIACGMVLALARGVTRSRRLAVAAMVVSAWLFAAMTGFPVSAVRACAMASVVAASQLLVVRPDPLAALSCGATALLLAQPGAAFDVGFALSVSAVSGLLVFGRLAEAWLAAAVPRVGRRVVALISAALTAQAATLPVSASAFGAVSLLAPAANAAIVPMIEPALALTLAGLCLGGWGSVLGRACLASANGLAWLVTRIAGVLATVPGACVSVAAREASVVALVGLGVVWAAWPRPTRRAARKALACACMLALVAAFGRLPVPGLRITVLDVGQGDAILVQSGWRTLLVDTGPDPAVLRKALGRRGIRQIDAVVLTHAHDDHTGGLAGLRGVVHPRWIGVSGAGDAVGPLRSAVRDALGAVGARRVVPVVQGDRFRVGSAVVAVIWPKAEATGLSTNDTSVVLVIKSGKFEAVLTGDAESPVEDVLNREGLLSGVEVLKVPHHGSENGLDEVGAVGWRPRAALISVGEANDFRHPSQRTLDLLRSVGARVYRTDLDGDVTVLVRGGTWSVRTQRVRRGMSAAGSSRSAHGWNACVTIPLATTSECEVWGGSHECRRPEAGVSDPRQGRVLVAIRGPPLAGHVRSGGSVADGHRCLRRQASERGRGRGSGEHAAVLEPSTARPRAKRRGDACV